MPWPQLHWLSQPFPASVVQQKRKGGRPASYVNHGVVSQRLLMLGPYSFRVLREIRGLAPEIERTDKDGNPLDPWPAVEDAVVGVVVELEVVIDGRRVVAQDVGDCEFPAMRDHDAARAKNAVSDGLKRAARHMGVALDLWSKGAYMLPDVLASQLEGGDRDAAAAVAAAESGVTLDPDRPDPDALEEGQ